MYGERFLFAALLYAAGFASAVIVGARNGEQMADGARDIVDACDAVSRDDLGVCLDRVGMMAAAVHALGDRCVLAVPNVDNLRVVRMPKGLQP